MYYVFSSGVHNKLSELEISSLLNSWCSLVVFLPLESQESGETAEGAPTGRCAAHPGASVRPALCHSAAACV